MLDRRLKEHTVDSEINLFQSFLSCLGYCLLTKNTIDTHTPQSCYLGSIIYILLRSAMVMCKEVVEVVFRWYSNSLF